jgi:hypothetical protein
MHPSQPPVPAQPGSHRVYASDVLNGTVDLRGYSRRFLLLTSRGIGLGLPQVVAAAEFLEETGWELISVVAHNPQECHAVLRRR